MASSNNFLTHDEIWDDSALVNAWDEALQEYKVSITPLPAPRGDRGDLFSKSRIPLADVVNDVD